MLEHYSPFNEYLGLLSFRIDWFHLLVAYGTLKSLVQLHNSYTLILQHSVFFTVQISHLGMTTRKTITLTIRTSVSKAVSLLFNMLSKFVIPFLSRTKSL